MTEQNAPTPEENGEDMPAEAPQVEPAEPEAEEEEGDETQDQQTG